MSRHAGSCQCGAVRYSAEIDLEGGGVTCTCSRCRRLGSIFIFTPAANFTLESGAGALTEYLFNRKAIRHQFCRTCGIEPFASGTSPDGTESVAINARTLDDVDPTTIRTRHHDGAAA